MYFADLTNYQYLLGRTLLDVFNVGWLDQSMPFSRGKTESVFLKRLEDWFEISRVKLMRGAHLCNFCDSKQWPPPSLKEQPSINLEGKGVLIGSCEIWIPGEGSTIYASPAMIIHYVEKHQYSPPKEFWNAVMNEERMEGWNAKSEFKKRMDASTLAKPDQVE
jgi:hypothetical protein